MTSVAELRRAFQNGELTPSGALERSLERIREVDGILHSFVALNPGARDEARLADERWRAGAPLGPLDGIPVGVKDNLITRGIPSRWGSRMYESFVPDQDELPIARLRETGAVLVGKTNTSEFASGAHTVNPLFPPTRNPWNPALTPGGSSGGSAAAVAGGLVPLAIGTDGGGSTRRPAAHSGIVGYKPSVDRIARAGGFAPLMYDMEVIGLLGTTVDDIRDAATLLATRRGTPARRGPLRVWVVTAIGDTPVEPSAVRAAVAVAELLAMTGHRVETGTLPVDQTALGASMQAIIAGGMARLAHDPGFELVTDPAYRALASLGSPSDEAKGIEWMLGFRAEVDAMFGAVDVIVTPSTATQAWDVHDDFPDLIAGRPAGPRDHAVFTPWVNAAGACAISVPAALDDEGRPLGVQLVAARDDDATLLALAEEAETALQQSGHWHPSTRFPPSSGHDSPGSAS